MKKKKSVKRRKPGDEDQTRNLGVQLDGVRIGPDYLIGPGSHPEFDYSQVIGPSIINRDEQDTV